MFVCKQQGTKSIVSTFRFLQARQNFSPVSRLALDLPSQVPSPKHASLPSKPAGPTKVAEKVPNIRLQLEEAHLSNR
jgi:hypothetical protein